LSLISVNRDGVSMFGYTKIVLQINCIHIILRVASPVSIKFRDSQGGSGCLWTPYNYQYNYKYFISDRHVCTCITSLRAIFSSESWYEYWYSELHSKSSEIIASELVNLNH